MSTVVAQKKQNWFIKTISSTIGRKLLMALTGLFVILFLTVHLAGNLQMLLPDEGEAFNKYAKFMGHNELIQLVSIGNFFFITLHIIVSLVLTLQNQKARPVNYAYSRAAENSIWSSRNMGILGTVILIFLVVHLQNFWFQTKFGYTPVISYEGVEYKNLYIMTVEAFSQGWLVALYVISMIGLSFHLLHGFQSAFQTIGLNHRKYTPFIKTLGVIYSILVPTLFAAIPLYTYLRQLMD